MIRFSGCNCLVRGRVTWITTPSQQQACRVHSENMKGLTWTRERATQENTFQEKNENDQDRSCILGILDVIIKKNVFRSPVSRKYLGCSLFARVLFGSRKNGFRDTINNLTSGIDRRIRSQKWKSRNDKANGIGFKFPAAATRKYVTWLLLERLPKVSYSAAVPFNLYPCDLEFRIGHRGLSRQQCNNQKTASFYDVLFRSSLDVLASGCIDLSKTIHFFLLSKCSSKRETNIETFVTSRIPWKRRLNPTTPSMLIPFISLKDTGYDLAVCISNWLWARLLSPTLTLLSLDFDVAPRRMHSLASLNKRLFEWL